MTIEAWRQSVERAVALAGAGDVVAALALAQTALAEYPQAGGADVAEEATVVALVLLGKVFFEAGYESRAKEAYVAARSALSTRPDLASSPIAATLHNNLGQAEGALGNLDEAVRELRAALALREATPGTAEHGFALDNLGNLLGATGHSDEALALQERALAIFERLGPGMASDAATTLGNLSERFAALDDLERAEAYRLRAFATHLERDGAVASATLLDAQALGGLYLKLRRNDRLDWVVNFLLAAGGDPPDPSLRFLAKMLKRLAEMAHDEFRLDLSARLLTRAVSILAVCDGEDAAATLSALSLLSNAQRASGARERARDTLQRVLEGYERLALPRQAAETRVALGRLYRELGAYPLAAEILGQAAAEIQAMPDTDPEQLASALGNRALCDVDNDDLALAEQHFAQALEVLAPHPDSAERPWLEHGLALLKYHVGAYDEALALFDDALRRWETRRGSGHPFSATCAENMALVYWSTQQRDAALAAFVTAQTCRDQIVRRQLALGSEAQRLAYAKTQLADLAKIVSFCLDGSASTPAIASFAAELLLRRKGLVLDSVAHTLRRVREGLNAGDRATLDQLSLVQAQMAQMNAPSLLGGAHADATQMSALAERERELQARLSRQSALRDPELAPLQLADVRGALPQGVLLMEYVLFPRFSPRRDSGNSWREERYGLMCTSRTCAPAWFDLGEAATIDERVDALRSALHNPDTPRWQIEDVAEDLQRLLIAPARAIVDGHRHLLIAPDGQLALVPFALPGLAVAADAAALVSYIATGRDLVRAPAGAADAAPVVIAAPDFDATVQAGVAGDDAPVRTRAGFEPLPGTEAEGSAVAALLSDATLITGAQATAQSLKNLHSPRILHIATHGVFNALPPAEKTWSLSVIPMAQGSMLVSHAHSAAQISPMLYSGLVLAGANRNAAGGNAAVVTAQEIANIDLRGTELVVLSACETGLGHLSSGTEFAGLRRALAIAGAATQVTSLWKVDDEATCQFMGYYYRALANGDDRALALAKAQRETATDAGHPRWAHPYYWAAFVSAGDFGPLDRSVFG